MTNLSKRLYAKLTKRKVLINLVTCLFLMQKLFGLKAFRGRVEKK
jgi:hypothetical protein